MSRSTTAVRALPLPLLLAACSSGGGGLTDEAPTVQVTQPAAQVKALAGEPVEIRWISDDPDDEASTDVVAVHVASDTEVLIVDDAPELNGVEQSAVWTPATGLPGLYRIEARISDGTSTATDVASGMVAVGIAPELPIGAETRFLGGEAVDVVLHADGSFTLGGVFYVEEPLVYAPGAANEAVETSDYWDVFFAHHGPDGGFEWLARTHLGATAGTSSGVTGGGQSGIQLVGLAPLANGGFLAALGFLGTVTVGLGEPAEATYSSTPGYGSTLFVAYDDQGHVAWSERPIAGPEYVEDLAFTGMPGGYAALGVVDEGATFGAGTPDEVVFEEWPELFLAAWNEDGSLRFAKPFAEVDDYSSADDGILEAGPDGITIAGVFEGDLFFGLGTPAETALQSASPQDDDLFLARYSLDGEFRWAQRIGGTEPQDTQIEPLAIAHLEDGTCRVLLAIDQSGSYVFGEGQAKEYGVTVSEDEDDELFFVAAYTATGELQWVSRIEGDIDDGALLVPRDATSCTLVADFGDEATLTPGNSVDSPVFLSEETPPGLGSTVVAVYGAGGEIVWALNDGGAHFAGGVTVPDASGPRLLLVGSSSADEIELGTNTPPSTILVNDALYRFGFTAVYGPEGEL